MCAESYYEVLGVPQNASKEEIKQAYRRLAKSHHPDSAGGGSSEEASPEADAGSERFRRAQEAYETLSDDRSRRQYDERMTHAGRRRSGTPVDVGTERRSYPWDVPTSGQSGVRGAPVWEEDGRDRQPFRRSRFGGFESLDSLFKRFMSGLAGTSPQRAAFDLVLNSREAAEGVVVPLDLQEIFPGSGSRGEVRVQVPANRRDGEVLTAAIERPSGAALEVELRVCVRD